MTKQKTSLRKLNNKGFSLVELIIVIGIMGVLMVILVPQFTKYLENSRVAKDETNTDTILNAVSILCNDGDVTKNLPAANVTITYKAAGGVVVTDFTPPTGGSQDAFEDALAQALSLTVAAAGDGDDALADTAKFPPPASNAHKGNDYIITIAYNTTSKYYTSTGAWSDAPAP